VRKIVLGLVLLLGGCVTHTFAPGPGMSSINFGPDSARCRIMARGATRDFQVAAFGSPKFVAASTGGAALGYAIGSAVEQNSNFNDCMEANGWRIADGQQPATVTTAANTVVSAQLPEAPTILSTTSQPVPEIQRRQFLVRAIDVNFVTRDFRPPHGVMILEVGRGGSAESAGFLERDVILDFDSLQIVNISDLQQALAPLGPNSAVIAHVERDGKIRPVSIHF
jgi:hypothetical protein